MDYITLYSSECGSSPFARPCGHKWRRLIFTFTFTAVCWPWSFLITGRARIDYNSDIGKWIWSAKWDGSNRIICDYWMCRWLKIVYTAWISGDWELPTSCCCCPCISACWSCVFVCCKPWFSELFAWFSWWVCLWLRVFIGVWLLKCCC